METHATVSEREWADGVLDESFPGGAPLKALMDLNTAAASHAASELMRLNEKKLRGAAHMPLVYDFKPGAARVSISRLPVH